MDTLNELVNGFAAAMTWQNLLFAFLGCLLGTIIGVLPGIGPVAGVALLIPLTLNMDATGAIIMLCAIFYGTAYGGTITSVLLNTPGEAASAKGVCLCTSEAPDLYDQLRQIASRDVAPVGDDELPP